ncbi:MAG TPA: ChuX/HutX family heme-like substrate-binding protein [Nitrososphaeraceae archaeon]|jgi:putative heme iron utilization protein
MSYLVAERLITDILSQTDIMLSVNSGSGICEVRIEDELPFRIRNQWATLGYEDRSWHIHLNMDKIITAKFVREVRTNGLGSYSIRFFDSDGKLAMRANFTKMYDEQGNLIQNKVAKFEEIFKKYGNKDELLLVNE